MQFEYKSKSFDIEGISQDDHIFRSIVRSGAFYEIDLLEYMYWVSQFWHFDESRVLIIDVGANIGNHTIFMRSFIADHLIAIEPNSKVIPLLRRNLSTNIDNYTVCECAVGQNEGLGEIAMPDNANNNVGMARVMSSSNGGDVKILTLDSVIGSWQQEQNTRFNVSLIKIDVEGMELDVLKGAEKTIKKYKPHLFVEAATNEEFQILNDYLCHLGYRKLSRWAVTPVYHFAHNPTMSLILRVRYIQLLNKIHKLKVRLTRRFTGR